MTFHDYLPDAMQQFLLTALLGPEETASRAASDWLDRVDFDAITEADRRLMPMLSHRLNELGIDHPLCGRIRGLYRRAWYIDRTIRKDLAAALAIVAQASQTPVILKGAALGVYAYARPAFRPFADLDVLVPPEDLPAVLGKLAATGAKVAEPVFHAVMVRLHNGREIDIHRSPYHMAFRPHHVRPLFSRLRPLAAGQFGPCSPVCYTLGDTDQLLHTIAHGLKPNPVAPIRWVVDAAMILRAAGEGFDWHHFIAEARRLELEAPAVLGLREVARLCHVPGLADALSMLETGISGRTLRRYRAEALADGPAKVWQATRRNACGPARLKLFAQFYRQRWGAAHVLKLFRKLGPATIQVWRYGVLWLTTSWAD